MKETTGDEVFDLNELLHPAAAFEHPSAVVGDPDLTLNESVPSYRHGYPDACAREAVPAHCEMARGHVVMFDDIMDALRSLDRDDIQPLRKYQRLVRRREILGRAHRNASSGSTAR